MSITHLCASPADTDTDSDQTHIYGSQCGAMAGAYPANQMDTECLDAEGGTNILVPVLPTASGEDGMVQTIPDFHRHAMAVPERAGTSDGTAVERMGSPAALSHMVRPPQSTPRVSGWRKPARSLVR